MAQFQNGSNFDWFQRLCHTTQHVISTCWIWALLQYECFHSTMNLMRYNVHTGRQTANQHKLWQALKQSVLRYWADISMCPNFLSSKRWKNVSWCWDVGLQIKKYFDDLVCNDTIVNFENIWKCPLVIFYVHLHWKKFLGVSLPLFVRRHTVVYTIWQMSWNLVSTHGVLL